MKKKIAFTFSCRFFVNKSFQKGTKRTKSLIPQTRSDAHNYLNYPRFLRKSFRIPVYFLRTPRRQRCCANKDSNEAKKHHQMLQKLAYLKWPPSTKGKRAAPKEIPLPLWDSKSTE
ncbi:hypothetical protein CEXT_589421 [Caerostris extrusa]|uniref:Uncharacterized protein n=1 Tax=Caerostris extrusa TaxID=172846 RepID=A0AAV4Y702_CAEEX|nr:hypothetical protein CEXT_589421 [Caerostris extrusa]